MASGALAGMASCAGNSYARRLSRCLAGTGSNDLRARAAAGMKRGKVAAPVARATHWLERAILCTICTLPSMPPISSAASFAGLGSQAAV